VLRQEFSVLMAPSGDVIYWIVKQFEETECVCVRERNFRSELSVAHLFVWKKPMQHGNNNKKSYKKCVKRSTVDWGLNQHCMENLS
jgi:hypothetical protein